MASTDPERLARDPERLARDPERLARSRELMLAFAERTGVASAAPRRRYLWTDAFAVCNFVGLARATGEQRLERLALELIDQVHHTLGRHRDDDVRSGWLSGLGEREGEEHPTRGGLRIGKRLPERGASEPIDDRLEWDRDGQYFHYLTRWMHALDVTARARSEVRFHRWARELAQVACRAFTIRRPDGPPRMFWKLSIDLSRPLVASMGQHDPLDGLITYAELQDTGRALAGARGGELADEIATFAAMLADQALATSDPLGLGGLLVDAGRAGQLARRGAGRAGAAGGPVIGASLVRDLLGTALAGLPRLVRGRELGRPAEARLPFRELGLAIGLAAVEQIEAGPGVGVRLAELARYLPLRRAIESFWLEPAHRRVATWTEHQDINDVMLATALAPDGYLALPSPGVARTS